jgi:polygalacturonase
MYPCFSLRLRSRVTLQLDSGCILLSAQGDHYDLPEPQPATIAPYQDFGHNHWHNSLIWGEDLDQVAITGSGILWGKGLNKGDGPNEERPGAGNKAIALKNCRNVLLRDLVLRDAGHFGVLSSGVDNLTIENLRIDTRRDGIDIDSCRNVHISNCTVNAPWDDAIVLKSSFSLGRARPTEQVTISNCTVTGSYQLGSLLDATFLPFPPVVPNDAPSHVGRIKIGTETNGDIRNIVVSNCVFEGCHGLAVESGAWAPACAARLERFPAWCSASASRELTAGTPRGPSAPSSAEFPVTPSATSLFRTSAWNMLAEARRARAKFRKKKKRIPIRKCSAPLQRRASSSGMWMVSK